MKITAQKLRCNAKLILSLMGESWMVAEKEAVVEFCLSYLTIVTIIS